LIALFLHCIKTLVNMTFPRLLKAATIAALTVASCHAFSLSSEPAKSKSLSSTRLFYSTSPEEALKLTASKLERLQRQKNTDKPVEDDEEFETIYRNYISLPANALKAELKQRKLLDKGRKPDLARRLAEDDKRKTGKVLTAEDIEEEQETMMEAWEPSSLDNAEGDFKPITKFCGLKLSSAAGQALGKANFRIPTPIQKAAIPLQVQGGGESLILHAETGSGKTLAYLLPITEQLWLEHQAQIEDGGYGLIMLPTRELAAQVAGIATALAPPGTVRMVSYATNLMSDGLKDRGEMEYGGRFDRGDGRTKPRLFIGSAKSIMHSLYGDGKMPASPTTKPEAQQLLQSVRWVVLDEVDRLLNVRRSRGAASSTPRHEKPAAVVTSAVARLTLGRAKVVSASATVGRSLKRELSRVLGLSSKESPLVVRGNDDLRDDDDEEPSTVGHIGRAVTIPDTVKHYVIAVDTSSVGNLLTNAFFVLKNLNKTNPRRVLLVLTRGCGLNTQNAVGALKHFSCKPEPRSLLDVLEADGTDRMIEVHRQVSGATGVGESYFQANKEKQDDEGYLLVTGEDSVRGLHLDGLDVVVIVGRPHGPDEYTHIAGRTGRAGREGKVIQVLNNQQAAAVNGWERMLGVPFEKLDMEEVENLD
jgi:superfamily II DNA/RNA helicase